MQLIEAQESLVTMHSPVSLADEFGAVGGVSE